VLFLAPDLGARVNGALVVPPVVAEVWMLGYLLVRGVRSPTDDGTTGTPGAADREVAVPA